MLRNSILRNSIVCSASAMRLVSSIALCVGASCCAAAPPDAEATDTGDHEITGEPREIATVDVGYGKVTFTQATLQDGQTIISRSEFSPNTFATTPLDAMNHLAYTDLEVFQAISPGTAAPEELRVAHAAQASALGRESDAVVSPTFNKDATIQKSQEACEDFVFEHVEETPPYICKNRWAHKRIKSYTGGDHRLHLVDSDYATERLVTLGICNESSALITGKPKGNAGDGWVTLATYTVAPGLQARFWNSRYFVCSDLSTCQPVRYMIDSYAPEDRAHFLATADLSSFAVCP